MLGGIATIKGLTEYEKYLVVRPVIGGSELDDYDMPVIRKTQDQDIDWENLRITSFRNLSKRQDNMNTLVHMFRYDKELHTLWNNPLKRIPLFRMCAAISTPDFSIYSTMNLNDIRTNVYRARWLGRTWQNYGCTVIPTVGWTDQRSYDVCFSGIEKGTPVLISTLGCTSRVDDFMMGFEEMKKRLEPSIIVVYGKMIPGMVGTFLHFPYQESFRKDAFQIRMEGISNVFTIREAL